LYEVIAESCIPGINTENFETIFEEQIVIPSLNNSQNVQDRVSSNVFSIEEKTFYFGTLVPSKNPKGVRERFKISNPGKIPANVKFEIKKRPGSNNDLSVFSVEPKEVKIQPHDSVYAKVTFKPTIMASYGAQFEALVDHGD
jgi:hydrocephalus-inducing protein